MDSWSRKNFLDMLDADLRVAELEEPLLVAFDRAFRLTSGLRRTL